MKSIPLELSEQDRWILERLHAELGESRAQVLRWALRFYALYGPYSTARPAVAGEILDHCGRLVVGSADTEVSR